MRDDLNLPTIGEQAVDATPKEASGKPLPPQAVVGEDALKIAKASLVSVGEHFPWAGPLLESVALRPTSGAVFVTCWGGTSTGIEPFPDPQKHSAYVAHMEQTIREACPWLLPLFECAGATVIVGPGVFCFMVPHNYGVAHEVPQIQPFTYLLPWVDPTEGVH
jgi:hypothetical protein